jgi:hypothetical protein
MVQVDRRVSTPLLFFNSIEEFETEMNNQKLAA